jgi:hypothetical protein
MGMMKIIAQVKWKHDKRTDGFDAPLSRGKKRGSTGENRTLTHVAGR